MRRPTTPAQATPPGATAPVPGQPRWPAWLMGVLLVLVTMAVYWPATGHDFINFDDPLYVTDNPHIRAGLTWEGVAWAFGRVHGEGTYWHPLSWISHMVDCQLYGLKPRGHHLTNVLLHAANAVLVFLVFRRMTGAFWRCALLAAFFALHPLQVDSVAWVAERKNLLSAFFWLLTTWAYVRYVEVQSPKAGVRSPRSISDLPSPIFYLLSLFFFALGLMCKPVLVTLPFVLLLLDYWPLGRLAQAFHTPVAADVSRRILIAGEIAPTDVGGDTPVANSAGCAISRSGLSTKNSKLGTALPLLVEKLPFLALAAASSLVTVLAHQALGILDSVARLPLDRRVENALVSYGRYLGKIFWPSRLAVFYPYPAAWPGWEVAACGLLLLVISGLVLGAARSRPSLLVGWCWFLGVLVPFSGLVQAGAQAMADRFMYVPILGLFVALIWGWRELAGGGRSQRLGWSAVGGAALVLCLLLTRQQLGYWRDSEALLRHALDVTENNYVVRHALGVALGNQGQTDEALRQLQEALRLRPDRAEAHNDLGAALGLKGQIGAAIRQFQEAIRLRPDYADARDHLGAALVSQGQMDEAIRQLQEAIRLKPDHPEAHYNLGVALGNQGYTGEAIRQYREAIRLKPDNADAHYNLGVALATAGQTGEAIHCFAAALKARPGYAEAHNHLGLALVRQGQIDEAIRQFEAALRLKPDYAGARQNLDAALAARAPASSPPPGASANP